MTVARILPFVLMVALPAAANPVTLRFDGGFVTLSARNAPLRQVLAEWARLGQTRVVNVEKLQGGMVTLELVHVPEKQALEVLLQSASGYLAAPRIQVAANISAYSRIVVMPTSSAAPPPAAGGYRVPPPQMPQQLPPQMPAGPARVQRRHASARSGRGPGQSCCGEPGRLSGKRPGGSAGAGSAARRAHVRPAQSADARRGAIAGNHRLPGTAGACSRRAGADADAPGRHHHPGARADARARKAPAVTAARAAISRHDPAAA